VALYREPLRAVAVITLASPKVALITFYLLAPFERHA